MSAQSRIELYKEAIAIEQERAALESRLDQLKTRLDQLKTALISKAGSGAPRTTARARVPAPTSVKRRAGRGELKQQILDALAAAGDAGLRVRDLASTLGTKQTALHSWFQFARKSIKAIRKAGRGRYRLAGAVPAQTPAKPTLQAQAKKVSGKPRRSMRGAVSAAVESALKTAGPTGIQVSDLAKTLGMNPRNLFVWFATTGKKLKSIRKLGPGLYSLNA